MLTERQKQILAFCATGRKSREIAKLFNLGKDSIYGELRLLQRLGLLEKRDSTRRGVPVTFTTIGDTPQLDTQYENVYDPALVNVDFIKSSHNIWGQAA